jgi:hypothetical protein
MFPLHVLLCHVPVLTCPQQICKSLAGQTAYMLLVLCTCSAPVVGFKAVPSGDVGTNAWSEKREKQIAELESKGVDKAEAKALASGRYTFYQVCSSACVRTGGEQDLQLLSNVCTSCMDAAPAAWMPHGCCSPVSELRLFATTLM